MIEDIELAMRALLHHPRIVLSEAPAWAVWHDHDHPGRLSRLMDARAAASHVTAMNKLLDLIDRCGGDGKTLRLGLRRCMNEGRLLYLNGRPREAMALFALARSRGYAIHHGPAFERLLARLLGTRRVLALRTAYTAIKRGGRHQ